MNPDLVAYLAVFGGSALFTAVLTFFALRLKRRSDAENLAERGAEVGARYRELLAGPDFLWAVWQEQTRVAGTTMLVRNAHDEVVTRVAFPSVPADGVLQHFELDGVRYEIRKSGLMSSRTCLRRAGHDAVLLSADHTTFLTVFFRGDGQAELCRLRAVSPLRRFGSLQSGGQEIGRLIIGPYGDARPVVLSLPAGRCALLEQVFVLASR
ncbi:MAG: hypothetical protein JNJ89_12990 [Rubrivivax sp.]|nr:hypothetical protein [Rubrivivax sp.]